MPYAFDPSSGPAGNVTHRITISGGDQLGLVARLSEVFKQYEANIVRLEARKLPGAEGDLYATRFAVSIPKEKSNLCIATVGNTAGSLGLSWQVEENSSNRVRPATNTWAAGQFFWRVDAAPEAELPILTTLYRITSKPWMVPLSGVLGATRR